MSTTWHVILLALLLCLPSFGKETSEVIQELTQKVLDHQQQTNVSLGITHWAKQAGLWPSYIHINFVGDPVQTVMRNDMTVLDENMFVTAWILEILLEAQEQNMITLPASQVQMAVTTLLGFRDQNYPAPAPVYSFWPQVDNNGTWVADPTNIREIFELFTGGRTPQAFYIPADSDDAAINLSLGTSLYRLQEAFPESYQAWREMNVGPGAMDHLTKAWKNYAYRPFVNDSNVDIIDPRTYYWMGNFLNSVPHSAEVSYFTTWLLDVNTNRQSYDHDYAMPFNVNNVDASVVANTIQGITRTLLYAPPGSTTWFDEEIQQIYTHSVDLVAWVINQRLLDERPDIVLLYYMGNYNFYWFVSRTVYLLNSVEQTLSSPLLHAQQTLTSAMRSAGTAAIRDHVQYDDDLRHKWAYWDNFLGVNDTTEAGEPKNNADDRIATTAIVVNALLDTWTTRTSHCNYTWHASTPRDVKKMVTQGVNWLVRHGDGHRYRHENAFFSGSVKGNDLPFWFPQNYLQYLNGTDLTDIHEFRSMSEIGDRVITGFSGVVSEDEYQSLLGERWFGESTPTKWDGYNVSSKGTLIYWSSPDFTLATTITALGKSLQTCDA